jgi:hypothetical protein
MSMTRFQLEGLHLLGYTRRESEFLFLVATHSGYFTNRQFKSFARTESGSISHAFIRKLLDRKHASYHAYRSGGRVYHVFARKVYQAIERENLRTRKKHELEYIKTRLVALDFVLEHPELSYLETEAEKVAFFLNECKVAQEALPVKQYRAKKSAEVTPRYFVDRFPVIANPASASAVVTFTYVDAGAVTLGGFGTHLRAYRGMLQSLPKFEFIYLAPTARLFRAAESEFYQVLGARPGHSKSANILEYFRLRKAWDARERVTSADVVLLQEAQQRFVGGKTEELYEEWRHGIVGDDDVMKNRTPCEALGEGSFRAQLCGSSLRVFRDPLDSEAETTKDVAPAKGVRQVSGGTSSQVSGS